MIDYTQPYLSKVAEAKRSGRWTISRKVALLDAIRRRELTEGQALAEFKLTEQELADWRTLFAKGGAAAMRVSRLQDYR